MSSADIPTPARPTGSLTCIVEIELSPKMDTAMTVTTVVTGPVGHITNTSQPVMGGTITYTNTVEIGRNVQSGNYMCAATLHSAQTNAYIINSSPTTDSVQFVTTGEIYGIKLHTYCMVL